MRGLFQSLCLFFAVTSCDGVFAGEIRKFMPDNDLYRMDHLDSEANISEDQFEAAIAEAEHFYKPLVKELYGAELKIVRDWKNPTVNAYATRSGKVWEVHMFGGLARRSEVSSGGFSAVICHELGHHLAGFPQSSWASNEGQSDYFSTLSCLRTLWQDQTSQEFGVDVEEAPKRLCDASWSSQKDRTLCYRVVQAGKSLADLLSQGTARYDSPDKKVVARTNNEHPAGQCRLDTYLAGAVCHANFDPRKIPKTEAEAAKFSCLESKKQAGFRPKCWFKPAL